MFNTVGPRQTGRYGMVIPRLVRQALTDQQLTVYGNGEQTRCFAHVLDVVPVLVRLMECEGANGKVVNVGSEEEVSINELAERVRVVVNPGAKVVRVPYEKAYGPGFEDMGARKPSVARVRELVGFEVTRDLDTIIRDVAEGMRREGEGR